MLLSRARWVCRLLVLVGMSSALWGSSAPTAWACTCVGGQARTVTLSHSHVVFFGRVTAIDTVEASIGDPRLNYPVRVTFEVIETYRGMPRISTEVFTGHGESDCGFPFQIGATYLVYTSAPELARRPGEVRLTKSDRDVMLMTGICMPTRVLADAERDGDEEIRFLRTLPKAPPGGSVGPIKEWDQADARDD